VLVYNVFQQLQADLIHMDNLQGALAKDNDGIKYLLIVIDCFSKYAWVVLLKDKKAESIIKAFQPILEKTHSEFLQVDKRTEFYNISFKIYLKNII
jgi:hypothetical protein